MSGWEKKDLARASYRQIEFDFIDIDDGFKKAVAKYDYPYADGSDLEDMGLESRSVRIKAVFMGETYNNLSAFIEALKEHGPGEVEHPVFGTFKAVPESVSIRHDERAYFAEVDITFIEHKDLTFTTPLYMASSKLSEDAGLAMDTGALAEGNLKETIEDDGIPEDMSSTGLGEPGFMATIAGYPGKVRDAMRKVDAVVGTVKGYINLSTAAFKLITSAVSYTANLPGDILGSFAQGIESVAGAYMSLINAPGRFTDSFDFGLKKMEAALGDFQGNKSLKASWHSTKAAALAASASIELAADESAENGGTLSLKAYGYDTEVSRTQLMTLDEIDAVVTAVREAVNIAIEAVREAFGDSGYDLELSLKAQALLVQQTADTIRLRRERIIDYEAPSDTSLHIIAFNLYGDMNEAERLLRINRIINPNFIKCGQVLRVYA